MFFNELVFFGREKKFKMDDILSENRDLMQSVGKDRYMGFQAGAAKKYVFEFSFYPAQISADFVDIICIVKRFLI